MVTLSNGAKESIIKKALNRRDKSIVVIAKENNLSKTTLYRWLNNCKSESKNLMPQDGLLESEAFIHLLATEALDELGVGSYCREHGIYRLNLNNWKSYFMNKQSITLEHKKEIKELKDELVKKDKELVTKDKELSKKDKILAEALALLVLKKKIKSLVQESEDD